MIRRKKKPKPRKKQSAAVIESLEARTLFSADIFGGAFDGPSNDDGYDSNVNDALKNWDFTEGESAQTPASAPSKTADSQSEEPAAPLPDTSSNAISHELVVVDTATPGYQQIIDDILTQSDDSRQIEVVLLDSERDGLEQLSALLSSYSDLDALHIISHGDAGEIALGKSSIDLADLQAQSDQLFAWQTAFSEDADLLIYGCDLASTAEGELFINTLAQLTGADVAASDDLTGSAELGGDWALEYSTGSIETDLAVSIDLQQKYDEVLVNTAPVLSGANDLNAINEDEASSSGTLISSLINGQISDVDVSGAEGVAIVAMDNSNGSWEYTTDGSTWLSIPANTDYENALLLAADSDNAVRFVPNADFNGSVANGITFHAWDQSTGTDGVASDITISETLLDEFNAVSYSNTNDFPASGVNWNSDWVEAGDDANPAAGDFMVTGNALQLDAKTNGAEISRQADLSSAVSATLSFSYQNDLNPFLGIGNKQIAVEVSGDGGANYDTLFTFDKNNRGAGSQSYDISNYLAANTQVRFVVTDTSGSNNYLTIDNFKITYLEPDAGGTTALSTASYSSGISVSAVNDAPINTVPGPQSVNEDTPLALGGISVNDVDGDLSTVELAVNDGVLNVTLSGAATISAGANGSNTLTLSGTQTDINATLVSLTYQGDADFNGSETLSVTSADSNAVMDYDTVAITVNAVDDLPTAVNDSDSTAEDTQLTGDLSTNDTASGDGGNTWSLNTGPSNGVVTVNADGTFTYTPSANYNGADSFTYTITDADGDTSTATMNITVTAVDDSPAAAADTYLTSEDNAVAGNLSSNDTASGDGGDTWSLDTGPSNGGVVINANGTFNYTPDPDFNGSDSFTYKITDADGDTNIATVIVTISAVDDAPTAAADSDSTPEDTPLVGDLSSNDTASGDGGNIWSLTTDASNGAVVLNTDGTFTYTPNANYNGADSFTYSITDADGDTSTATMTLTVTAVDDLPVAVDDNYTTSIDATVSGTLAGNDTQSGDGGNVWSLTTPASNGTAIVNADGTFTYTPNLSYNGADSFTYTITDVDGDTSIATVNITVANVVNDAPINTVPGPQSVNEDTPLALGGISVNDVDGDLSTVELAVNDGVLNVTLSGAATISAGANGSNTLTLSGTQTDINATLVSLTYQGDADFNGSETLSVTSADSNAVMDYDTVAITVNAVDDLPTAVNDSDSTAEDTQLTGDLSTNDTASGDGGNTWSLNTGPSNGVVTVNADGTFTYTPSANYNGADSFTYTITDADGDTSTATMNITVTAVDDSPAAAADTYLTSEDNAVAGNLSSNDAVSGDGGNTWSLDTGPSNGGVVINTNGTFTYTPAPDFNGTDSFTYKITDADGDISIATATVTVSAINDTPTAAADSDSTPEDTPLNGDLSSNDTASGDGGNIWSLTTDASNGAVVLNTDGTFTYTPNANYNGADSFTYTITDGDGDTSTATMSLTVTAANDPPINTVPGAQVLNEDTSLLIGGISVADGDGDLSTVQLSVNNGVINVSLGGAASISAGANGSGSLTLSGTQSDLNTTLASVTYQSNANYSGADTLTVLSTDSNAATDTDTVAITVNAVNDVPTLVALSSSTVNENTDTSAGYSVGSLATTDVDVGDTTTYSIVGGADEGVFSIGGGGSDELILTDGILDFELQPSYEVVVRVTDSAGFAHDEVLTVSVNNLNEAPVIVSSSTISAAEEQTAVTTVTAFDEDIADTLTYTITGGDDAGKFAITTSGVLTFLNPQDFSAPSDLNGDGTYLVEVTVDDGNGLTDVQAISVVLADANAAPVLAGANDLSAIDEDPVGDNGTLVSALIAGQISDGDAGALEGIAIVGVDNTNGSWEYTTDGTNWSAIGAPSISSSLLLAADADNAVRFVPNANWNGTVTNGITFHAWDQSTGVDGASTDLQPTNTLRDQFDVSSYANNDGSKNWKSNWIEVGDGSGATGGDFRVTGGQLRLDGKSNNDFIYREADLGSVTSATLSFDYDNTLTDFLLGDKQITLQISGNGGGSWTTLDSFQENNNGSGSRSYDITSYSASNTQVRFIVTNADNQNNYLKINNFQIFYQQDVGGTSALSAATASSSITVNPVNDAATVSSDSVSLSETNAALSASGTLTSTDIDNPNNSFTASSTTGTYGNLSIDAAGNWNFTANAAFDELAPLDSYSETFNVSSVDGTPSTVQITITGTNDNPTLTAGSISASEDQLEAGYNVNAATSNLLSGAADIDDSNSSLVVGQVNGLAGNVGSAIPVTLSYTDADGVGQSQAINLTVNADGSYSLGAFDLDDLPDGSLATVNFTYTAMDDQGLESPAQTATITITGTNDNPTLTAGSISANEDQLEAGYSVNAATSNLLSAAADIDDVDTSLVVGQVNGLAGNVGSAIPVTLSYTDADGVGQSQAINLTVNADGSYSLAAFDLDALPDGSVATVNFTYTAMDDQGLESPAQTATITITGTNDNPTLSAGSISANEDQLEAGYSVNAATSNLLSAAADIDDVNSSLVVGQVNGLAGNVGSAIPVTLSYTDADGVGQSQTINLIVNADGSYSLGAFDLDALPDGNLAIVNFTYTSMDDQGLESPAQTATITITGTNDNPTLTAGSITATEDQLEVGYSVNAATSNLLTGAADIDDMNSSLVVGQVNGLAGNVGSTIPVTLSYTDADGVGQSQAINLTVNADGSYSLGAFDLGALPNGNNATVNFTYTSMDGQGLESAAQTATITITGTNDNPTLVAGSISASEDQLEAGYSVNAATSNLLSAAADIDDVDTSLVVGQVNGLAGNVGSTIPVTLSYTDADGVGQSQAINLTVNADGSYSLGAFDLDALPDGNLATVNFTYTAMDDQGLESTAQTATLTITGTNDNPTLTAGSISASEDQLEAGYSVNAATSNLLTGAADIDDVNSSLVVGQVNGLAGNVGSSIPVTLSYTDADGLTQTQSIDLTVNADGSYSLSAFDLDALPDGNLATVNFTYTAMDDQGLESSAQTATVTITITGTNDNPTLSAGSITASEDQLEAGYSVNAASSNLLTDAADVDDANSSLSVGQVNGLAGNVGSAIPVTLSYTDADGVGQSQAINLTVNADGSYSLGAFDLDALPDGNLATVNFTYTAMDDQGLESTVQTATITITGTNDNPALTAGSISANEDQLEAGYSVNAATSNLLTGAADIDDVNSSLVVGQVNGLAGNVGSTIPVTLSYTDADGVGQSQAIDLTVNADGSYSLAAFDLDALPDGNLATVNFTYTAMDDQGLESPVQTATITITGTNDNPTLSAGSISANEDQLEAGYSVNAATSNLLSAAADIDDVDASLVVGQVNGLAGNVGSAIPVTLSYTDADGVGQIQTINLIVNTDGSYSLGAFDLDALPDGNLATVNFTYTSMDDQGLESTVQTATITITGTNDAPINTVPGVQSVNEDTLLLIGGTSVYDVDDTQITVQLSVTSGNINVSLSGSATITAGANGTGAMTLYGSQADLNATLAAVSYQGDLNYHGPDNLVVTTTDSHATSVTNTVAIMVNAVNDAPTGLVDISGTSVEGQTLSLDASSIQDVDGLGAYSYQWLRDGVAIEGASDTSYILVTSDLGARISVNVSYIDGDGTSQTVTSAVTGPVSGDASSDSSETNGENVVTELALSEINNEEEESENDVETSEGKRGLNDKDGPQTTKQGIGSSMFDDAVVNAQHDDDHAYIRKGHGGSGYDGMSVVSKFLDLRLELLNQVSGDFTEEIGVPQFVSTGSYAALADELYQLGADLDEALVDERQGQMRSDEVSIGISMSLTAGVVSWVLRGGALLASFMTVAPLWRQIDPLPILSASTKREEKEIQERDEAHDDEEDVNAANLEKFFDKGL